MTRPAVAAALVVGALAVPGCGSPEGVDSHAPDAGAVPDAADAADEVDAADRYAPSRCLGTGFLTTFTEKRLSTGFDHTCGIRDNGTVACWGAGEGGRIDGYTVPPAGTFVRVAAGFMHTCGIRTSGEVECWGAGKTFVPSGSTCVHPECGQSIPPPGTFIEIAAGYDSTCGLRPDCTIECWGNVKNPPPAGQFVQMDVWQGGCAVQADGHGQCWADFSLLDNVKQVSLGDLCSCVLHTNGEADCAMGRSSQTSPPYTYTEKWNPTGVAVVSCGFQNAYAILEDGTVDSNPPWGPPFGTPPSGTFTEVTCGFAYCCGLRTDGTVTCFTGEGPVDVLPPNFPKGP